MVNYFVDERKKLKEQINKLWIEQPELTNKDILVIVAKRSGLKHTTIETLINEVEIERDYKW